MSIDPIIPSTLHVTACEIDVSQDLQAEQTKSIGQLILEYDQEKENIQESGQPPRENR